MQKNPAFTLAELLIALSILGLIATFTIPKVLQSQQNGAWNSESKEMAGSLAGAYTALQAAGNLTTNTGSTDFMQYLNYVKADSSGILIDGKNGFATRTCDATFPCLFMHNGGILQLHPSKFNGSTTTNYVTFFFDPDARVTDGTTNGPGKSVEIMLFYNGKLTSAGKAVGPICNSFVCPYTPASTDDPSWFNWN